MPRSPAAARTSPVPPSTSRRVGDRLRADWERLRRDPVALRRASSWGLVDPPLRDLDQVLAAVGHDRPPAAGDEHALRRLVAVAAFEPLAARVVLQRLLPALVARARHHGGMTEAALDELVGAAWIAVTTFDQRRRPAVLAAALVGDAVHRAFRAPARRRLRIELAADVEAEVGADVGGARPGTADELDAVFRLGRIGGIAAADLELLRRLLLADRADDVADALRVTARTVRNRRTRITEQLRELAA